MKKLSLLLIALCCIVATAFSQGTTCATAVTVTAGTVAAPASYSAVAATGTGASGLHAAAGAGSITPVASRWYKYTPAASGSITIGSCGSPTGSDTRLWVMTGTCAGLTDVATDDDGCGTQYDNIYLSTITMHVVGGTTYYFEWDDTWETAAFNWTLAFTPAAPYDAALASVSQEYSMMPRAQIAAMPLTGSITNYGLNALTAAKLTVKVYNAANTVIQTYTSPATTLAADATATFTAGTWTPPTTLANYKIEYILSHANSATDATPLNDTIRYPFSVTADVMGRDDNVIVNRYGGAGTATVAWVAYRGQEFTPNVAGLITSLDINLEGGAAGDTIQLEIYTVTAGVLSANPIVVSLQTFTAPVYGWFNMALPTPLAVAAGTKYMVAFKHISYGSGMYFSETSSIYTANKIWLKTSNNPAWLHPETFGLYNAYMMRVRMPLAGPDAKIAGLDAQEYILLPQTEITPQTLSVKVSNGGTTAATTALKVTVTNTTTAAVVYTNTTTAATIAPNATQIITAGTWTPPNTIGVRYNIKYTLTTANDTNSSNDSLLSHIKVTASAYSRSTGPAIGGLGITGTATTVNRMTQGSEFVFPNAARIDSVTATIGGGSIGDSIRAEIYLVSASGIVSSTPVATSPYTILTTTTGGVKTLGLSTIFTPTVGRKYVVALWHSARNADILLQYTANIYTVGKNWFRISNSVALGIWRHPESYGFDIAYMVRPHVICPVMTLTGTVVGSSGNNGSITVTSVPATGLSYAWSNGATTASITGLTAATYTVTATNTASGCSVSTAFSVQTVGTQNTKNIAAFAAFPNPTSDVLTVNYTLQNAERVHIQITNALGQILDNKDLPAAMQNSLQFNLAAYPSGTYFVQLQTSDAHLNERVLLQH